MKLEKMLKKSDECIQTFQNEGIEYILTNGVLVEKERLDLQEQMNSRVVDTLTDLFNKYMNGDISLDDFEVGTDVIDYSDFQNKDKLELRVEAIQKHKQTLAKYNLPLDWTPQQLLDYANNNGEALAKQAEALQAIENEAEMAQQGETENV